MESPTKSQLRTIIEERITKVNGDFHVKKYVQGKLLGKGGFAKVYLFTNLENNKIYAGKVMPKVNFNRSRSRQKLMSEIKLHKSLHHPNIVKFEHVFEDHENIYIILELCKNQSMNDLLKRRKRLSEFEVQCYLIQMVDSIKYLHSNRIIHRDLKLGNLFLSENMQIKLGDFGLASKLEFDGEKKRTVCGTPNYIAPEIIDGNIGHSYEVDVWSLGVIIYILIIGKPPFETNEIKQTYKRIKENKYSFPDNVPISANAKDLITKILVTEPEKRLTLDEILLHPFIDYGGPIPKLMPTSTLACPPTTSYIKQFAPSSTSQRIRIATETDDMETNDSFKTAKVYYINTARPNHTPTTPSGKKFPQFDFFANTPRTPKLDFRRTSEKQIFFNTEANERHRPSLPIDFKEFLKTENIQETEEEDSPEKKIEEEKLKAIFKEGKKEEPNSFTRVLKWYDYSSKYGLGYVLTNGAVGVCFNDGSKLIENSNKNFEYITRNAEKKEIIQSYPFTDYPQEIHKRVLVFNHFKKHFELAFKGKKLENNSCYVKKWIQTKQATLFRMNTQLLQVVFKDDSILVLNTNDKKLLFIHKGNSNTYPLEKSCHIQNKDVSKRLKYVEEVIKTIWTTQNDAGHQHPSARLEQEINAKDLKHPPLDNSVKTVSTATTNN